MSFAETYSAATASIVVSPGATVTSCIGPQPSGVIAPLKVPVARAGAAPEKTPNASAPQDEEGPDSGAHCHLSNRFLIDAAARAALATGSGVTRKPDF